jgi:hypothetical protein
MIEDTMDGLVLFIKGWFFTLFFVYLYRRFWQTVGPRVPEFEAFCEKRPLLAALSVTPGSEQLPRAQDSRSASERAHGRAA